jgi:hypothetical protein
MHLRVDRLSLCKVTEPVTWVQGDTEPVIQAQGGTEMYRSGSLCISRTLARPRPQPRAGEPGYPGRLHALGIKVDQLHALGVKVDQWAAWPAETEVCACACACACACVRACVCVCVCV